MKKISFEGFTLLELMIVISLIGIIIMVSFPNMNSSRDNFKLYTCARNCVMDLRYAQQLSMNTKKEHGVYFYTKRYEIIKEGNETIKTVDLDPGIAYQEIEGITSDQIVFKTDGSPYESGRVTFKSTSSDFNIFINVTPGTGEVSVEWY